MTCSAASTLQPQATPALLPIQPPTTPGAWQRVRTAFQQLIQMIQGAGGSVGNNVIPQQYALIAGSTLPPIAATSNCTVAADTGTKLFGAGGSYKISITGSPATVTLSANTAWPLSPGWQWLVSFFQQASAAISGAVTITTPAGAYTTDFTTTLTASGWKRLYDTLNLGADTSTSFGLSFTFTGGTGQTVWLDGLMLEPYFNVVIQPSPFMSTSSPLTLDNQPDGTTYQRGQRYPFGNDTGTAGWMHLGTLILTYASSCTLRWHAGNGYNTGSNQQAISDVTIRASNGFSGAPNIAGISVITHGKTQPWTIFKAYATGGNTSQANESWELYAYCGGFTFGPLEVIVNAQAGDSFTFSGAAASDPGPASSTVAVGYVGQYLDPTQGSGLDGLYDGTTYYRFLASFLDGSRRVAGALGAISPLGSTPQNLIAPNLSYTSTTSSITWSWSAFTVYRNDGTSTTIPSGNLTVSGLSASTTYTFYPYISETSTAIQFATGYSNSTGSPAAAYTAASSDGAAAMYQYGHIYMNSVTAATPASGGGSGGGGGDHFGCLHPDQIVELADGGFLPAENLSVGMKLSSPSGETRITHIRRARRGQWVHVTLSEGLALTVTMDHRFRRPDGEEVRAAGLRLGEILDADGRHVEVAGLRLLKGIAEMVQLEVEPPHLYYLNGVLSHNVKP